MDYMGNDIAPILITGAAGYLGGSVLANLSKKRLSFAATSLTGRAGERCDLTDVHAVDVLLNRVKPSSIIHCAAVVPKTTAAYDDTSSAEASIAMLETLAKTAECPIVFASSMTVYSANPTFPVREQDAQEPSTGYARGKWLAEQVLFSRGFTGDVALRLPGLFGRPRKSGLLYNAAKSFLMHEKFALHLIPGIWAAMNVQDAAEYMVRAATAIPQYAPQPVNAGYEGDFSVLTAVKMVAECCGCNWNAPELIDRPFSMSFERLKMHYGMLPVTFRQRIEELVENVQQDMQAELA
jgi:nucleoside-diphosphate-sugar epimerase